MSAAKTEQELQQLQVEVEEKIKASPHYESVKRYLDAVNLLEKKKQPTYKVEYFPSFNGGR